MIGIRLPLPQRFLRAVGADDDSLISVLHAQGAACTVTLLDSLAHAAVNQKKPSVTLEESVPLSLYSTKLHRAWLMALN